MKYAVEKRNWYGFNHDKVNTQFIGGLTFINSFCIKDEHAPIAVYRVSNPDYDKGHKKYLLVQVRYDFSGLIRGMSEKDMKLWRYQDSILCTGCHKVIFSANRHDFHKCGCPNETMVDGGREYLRYGGLDMTKVKVVKLDFLTDTIKISRKKRE